MVQPYSAEGGGLVKDNYSRPTYMVCFTAAPKVAQGHGPSRRILSQPLIHLTP